jgi:hypothetical protein
VYSFDIIHNFLGVSLFKLKVIDQTIFVLTKHVLRWLNFPGAVNSLTWTDCLWVCPSTNSASHLRTCPCFASPLPHVLPTLHHAEYTSFSINELIKIKTLKSICSNLKHKQNRFCSNLAHAPVLTGYAPVHVTLGFQLSVSRMGSILSPTILHSVLTTDYSG